MNASLPKLLTRLLLSATPFIMISTAFSLMMRLFILLSIFLTILRGTNAFFVGTTQKTSLGHPSTALSVFLEESSEDMKKQLSLLEQSLHQNLPGATLQECERFIHAFGKGKPTKRKDLIEEKLREYLEWRIRNGLNDELGVSIIDDDTAAWDMAVRKARKQELKDNESMVESNETLNQVIFLHSSEDGDGKDVRDKSGKRILHVLPARIDTQKAPASVYADAIAFYLDSKFDRSSLERMTVLFDVRGGVGWPNPPAITMMNVITVCTNMLQNKFPTRLAKFILFPLPGWAKGLFNACKPLLRSSTVGKITLVPGDCTKPKSPLPLEALAPHISKPVVDQTERVRVALFDSS